MLDQVSDVFGRVAEFAFLDSVQWVEVVVDVLQARFAETGNAVHQFAGEVVALVVVKPFFEHGVVVETAHSDGSGTLHLLDELLLEFGGAHRATQSPQVLVEEGGDGELEIRFRVFQHLAELFAGVLAHQLQSFFAVGGLHQLFQGLVALLFRFAFLVHHLAAYQDEHGDADEDDDGNVSSVVKYEGDEEAEGEGGSGGDEPASDDA